MDGPVTVEIEVDRPIRTFEAFPAARFADARVAGATMRLVLPEPAAVVITVDGNGYLFLLPDPPELQPGAAQRRADIDVRELGADPTRPATLDDSDPGRPRPGARRRSRRAPARTVPDGNAPHPERGDVARVRRRRAPGHARPGRLPPRPGHRRERGRRLAAAGRPLPRADDDVLAPAPGRRRGGRPDHRPRHDRRRRHLPADSPRRRAEPAPRPRQQARDDRGRPVPRRRRLVAAPAGLTGRGPAQREDPQRPDDAEHRRRGRRHVDRRHHRRRVRLHEGRRDLRQGHRQRRLPGRPRADPRGALPRELPRRRPQGRHRVRCGTLLGHPLRGLPRVRLRVAPCRSSCAMGRRTSG